MKTLAFAIGAVVMVGSVRAQSIPFAYSEGAKWYYSGAQVSATVYGDEVRVAVSAVPSAGSSETVTVWDLVYRCQDDRTVRRVRGSELRRGQSWDSVGPATMTLTPGTALAKLKDILCASRDGKPRQACTPVTWQYTERQVMEPYSLDVNGYPLYMGSPVQAAQDMRRIFDWAEGEGWELVSTRTENGHWTVYTFKRKVCN